MFPNHGQKLICKRCSDRPRTASADIQVRQIEQLTNLTRCNLDAHSDYKLQIV